MTPRPGASDPAIAAGISGRPAPLVQRQGDWDSAFLRVLRDGRVSAILLLSARAGQLGVVEVLEKAVEDGLLGSRRGRQHAYRVHVDEAGDDFRERHRQIAALIPLPQLR